MMFNNYYVNQAYYQQQQEQILRYQLEQSEEVRKAVQAMNDLCKAVKRWMMHISRKPSMRALRYLHANMAGK